MLGAMACLLALFALISPRLALIVVWLFSDWLSDAFDSWLLPVLGFFLLPWTTLAYAWMWASGTNEVSGFEWFMRDPRVPLRPELLRRGPAQPLGRLRKAEGPARAGLSECFSWLWARLS